MSEHIEPAFTPEEWHGALHRQWHPELPGVPVTPDEIRKKVVANAIHGRLHKAAALALLVQPFGFSREDVALLKAVAHYFTQIANYPVTETAVKEALGVVEWATDLSSRIEALLPPANTTP